MRTTVDCSSHSGHYEAHCLLGCNTVQFYRGSPMFQRNILAPSSESKRKPSSRLLPAGYLLHIKKGGRMLPRNPGELLSDYVPTLHPRRQELFMCTSFVLYGVGDLHSSML